MSKIYVGIDPGKDGAVAELFEDNSLKLHKFPMIGTEYDLLRLSELINQLPPQCHIILENVHSIPKISSKGNWALSRGKALLEMAIVNAGLPYSLIHSKKWQKVALEGVESMKRQDGTRDTKSMCLVAAKRLFPNETFLRTSRTRVPDEGYIDAALMAYYGRKQNL